MSMLSRLFNRDHEDGVTTQECPHVALVPRWDRVEDMGHEDLATSFVCEACHRTLTPDQARTVSAEMSNRLRHE